jgi:hypothetical protein
VYDRNGKEDAIAQSEDAFVESSDEPHSSQLL